MKWDTSQMQLEWAERGFFCSVGISVDETSKLIYILCHSYNHPGGAHTMASEMIFQFTDSNFAQSIKSGVSLVDFWAEWCGPCRMQGPIVDKLATNLQGKAKIGKLNVDENPEVAQQFNVMSIPTILIFKDGQPVKQFVGVQTERTLTDAIAQLG